MNGMNAGKPQVAVTGATGFTGGALARRLIAEGYPTRVLARNPDSLEDLATAEVITGGFTDAAAIDRLVGVRRHRIPRRRYVSFGGSARGIHGREPRFHAGFDRCLDPGGCASFVYCSTGGVHGHVAQTPGDENSPIVPADPYQDSKWEAEKICQEAIREGKIDIVIIRPCGIYGPGDTRMLKIFRMAQKGTFLFVGDGRPNFHPDYVDDLVEGFMLAMTTPESQGRGLHHRRQISSAPGLCRSGRPRRRRAQPQASGALRADAFRGMALRDAVQAAGYPAAAAPPFADLLQA